MARQYGTTLRNDLLQQYEDSIGTSPKLRFYDGTMPATPATAAAGTQLVELTNATSNWRGAPSSGSSALAGTFTGTVGANGDCEYYRVYDSGGSTCHEQGLITQAFPLVTNGSTAAGSNVLNFASTSGVTVGMAITGAGVASGSTVLAVSSTTVTMSLPSISGVGSTTTIYFGDTSGELLLNAIAVTIGQVITVATWDRTAPGA